MVKCRLSDIKYFTWFSMVFLAAFLTSASRVSADGVHPVGIKLDGTIGSSGRISLSGPAYDIKAEYGVQTGSNLFHSFEQFNVHSGETATFNGPGSVQNIISRITGGSASWIDGQIASGILGANLYMLNPTGVMVGPNASLNVTGSFHISSADYLRFGNDGQVFSAYQPGESLITLTSPPSAFGFLDDSPAPISFEGKYYNPSEWDGRKRGLQVPTGETLSVIGGDIRMKGNYVLGQTVTRLGNLNAPEGTIYLASIASSGEVIPSPSGLDVSSFSSLGNITLSDQSLIMASGAGSGNIFIRGGQFYMDRSNIEADTKGSKHGGVIDIHVDTLTLSIGNIFSDTLGTGNGGDISITADTSMLIAQNSKIFADATGIQTVNGNAGKVSMKTKKLDLTSNSAISSETYGVGSGGSITILADDAIGISGGKIFTRSTHNNKEGTPGNAGEVFIETKKFSLEGLSILSSDTYGTGIGGSISITGSGGGYADEINIDGSRIFAGAMGKDGDPDHSGNVLLKAKTVSFINGGKIGSESAGQGKGGDVSISASDLLTFSGNDSNGYASRIYTTAKGKESSAGNAGNIDIQAGAISFYDGGGVTASTQGQGQGGSIQISASGLMTIDGVNPHGANEDGLGSGVFARSESTLPGAGRGGDIRISAGGLSVTQGGVVTSSSLGEGQGGTISVSAGSVYISGTGFPSATPLKSQITYQKTGGIPYDTVSGIYSRSESNSPTGGNAGNIDITSYDLTSSNSGRISTSTEGGGTAGAITITAGRFQMDSYASVSSSTNSSTNGGNAGLIDITASDTVNLTSGSTISTSSQGSGNAGQIRVQTALMDISSQSAISSSSNSSGYGGSAGTIDIFASDAAVVKSAGTISTSTEGQGNAGSISLQTSLLTLDGKAAISSASNSSGDGGDAGMILIAADTSAYLLNGSSITTSSEGGGNAGAIDIDTPHLYIDGTSILASAANSKVFFADAGSITIGTSGAGTDTIHLAADSVISTSSEGFGKGGDIILKSSEVSLDSGASLKSTGVNGDAGTIFISGQTLSSTHIRMGENSSITTSSQGTGDAGAINLNTLEIDMGANSVISSSSLFKGNSGNAGAIAINAGDNPVQSISMSDNSAITTSTEGTGSAGAIAIDVMTLEMNRNSVISSSSNSADFGGDAGRITIQSKGDSSDAIRMTEGSTISTSTQGKGVAGSIDLMVKSLTLKNDAVISSASNNTGESGDAGSITISAGGKPSNTILLADHSSISTSSEGTGRGGDITLDAVFLDLNQTSTVKSTGNIGDAGTVTVKNVKESRIQNGSTVSTSGKGPGSAGAIRFETATLLLDNSSSISSSSQSAVDAGNAGKITITGTGVPSKHISLSEASDISTTSAGYGLGGDIVLETDVLTLHSGSAVLASGNHGNAGKISVNAKHEPTQTLSLMNGSSISTSSFGAGDAGAVILTVDVLELKEESSISSASNSPANSGNAGMISINANDKPLSSVSVSANSSINTSSEGSGKGGNIVIDADILNLDNHSTIGASGKDGDAGSVTIQQLSMLSIRDYSAVSTSTSGLGNAGSVRLETKEAAIDDNSSVASSSNSEGTGGDAGEILIRGNPSPFADSIRLSNSSAVSTSAKGTGKGGNISIDAVTLALDQNSSITSAGKDGNAGSIAANGLDICILKNQSLISTSSSGFGNAGAILIDANRLQIDRSSISSSSNALENGGDGGLISIGSPIDPVQEIQLINSASLTTSTEGKGNAGAITIYSSNLLLDTFAVISSASNSAGKGGSAGTITLDGLSLCSLNNGSSITTSGQGEGKGGNISIRSTELWLDQSSSIMASGKDGDAGSITASDINRLVLHNTSQITTSTKGKGNAGEIDLTATQLEMASGASISSASTSKENGGNAGSITIFASNSMTLKDADTAISTESAGNGKAGDIIIKTNRLFMENLSSISSSSSSETNGGDAGTITVQADDFIHLLNASLTTEAVSAGGGLLKVLTENQLLMENSKISTSVWLGRGNGGDIDVSKPMFLIMKGSDIIAKAYEGTGGNIHIAADQFIKTINSVVSASSLLGIDGNVNIDSPDANLSGSLIVLPSSFLDVSRWAVTPCAQRTEETISRFIFVERDGVTSSVDDWLPSP